MNTYQRNIKWLVIFAPFTLLPFSGAFVTPFLLHNQLSQTEIFLLQSIYSITYISWNIPSGYLADKFGHARAIKMGAPIAAMAMIFYGFGGHFWQFALCEIGLALGEGLFQGADRALLIESLAKEKREKDYVKLSQRMSALGWVGAAIGVPVSILLVDIIGLGATLTADGCLIAIGALVAMKLRDFPREFVNEGEHNVSALKSVQVLVSKVDVRWLLILTISLSAAPFLAFWIAAPYYTTLGIPVLLFGLLFAIRSVWKAWLAHKFHEHRNIRKSNMGFATLAGISYLAMATQQIWLVWLVLGHDVIEALQKQPVLEKINTHISAQHRATLNSTVDMLQRVVYTIAGPVLGLVIDKWGLRIGLASIGICCSSIAYLAVWRLTKLKAI